MLSPLRHPCSPHGMLALVVQSAIKLARINVNLISGLMLIRQNISNDVTKRFTYRRKVCEELTASTIFPSISLYCELFLSDISSSHFFLNFISTWVVEASIKINETKLINRGTYILPNCFSPFTTPQFGKTKMPSTLTRFCLKTHTS